MWSRVGLFLIVFLVFAACDKNYDDLRPKGILGAPTSFLVESRYVSHSGNELTIELDIGVVSGRYADDLTWMEDDAFPTSNSPFLNHSLTLESVERIQLNQNNTYSNLILVDYTNGWDDIDLFNLRTMALNKSVQEAVSAGNQVGLAFFARDGAFSSPFNTLIYQEGNAFGQSYADLSKILYLMQSSQGGTSSFYDAVDAMVDYVDVMAIHEKKYVTVITKSLPDEENITAFQAIVNKAKATNVVVNMISLNNNFEWDMVSIPSQTNGFIHLVSSTSRKNLTKGDQMDQGTPTMASLHRILARNLHVYRVKLKLTKESGSWASGDVINYETDYELLERYSSGGIMVNNYIPFYVAIP